MNSNLSLADEEGVQPVCPAGLNIRYGIMAPNKKKKLREIPEKGTEVNEDKMLYSAWRGRTRALWIRKQAWVDDILLMIKKKKSAWASHVMNTTDNR